MKRTINSIYLGKIKSLMSIGLIALLTLLTGCLPAEKTTQCGTNEAFNATQRKCVPVLGSASGNAVFISSHSPANSYTTNTTLSGIGNEVTHNIKISDSYNFGYTVQWKMHFNSGAIVQNDLTVGSNIESYVFNPNLKGKGNYVLEAIILDSKGDKQLDSKTWNISVSDLNNPTINTTTPIQTAISYPLIAAIKTHTVQINNPSGKAANYTWYVNGVAKLNGSITSSSMVSSMNIIQPNLLGIGIHTVELRISDPANVTKLYDNFVWTVNVINPDLPQLTDVFSQSASGNQNVQSLYVINGIPFASQGFRRPDMEALNYLCAKVNDSDKNDDNIMDVQIQFEIDGIVQGGTKDFSTTVSATNPDANTYCIAGGVQGFNTPLNLINSNIGESKKLTIRTVSSGNTIEEKHINLIVRPKNITPIIEVDSDNSATNISCTASQPDKYNWTGCTINQSVDANNDGDYSDSQDVDNTRVISFKVDRSHDPDILTSNFKVDFEIKKSTDTSWTALNGSSPNSKARCTYSYADTQAGTLGGVSKQTCKLTLDAYGANGPITPGDYVVRASITDQAPTWSPGDIKKSNYITFAIAVKEVNAVNSISLAAQSYDSTDINTNHNKSWIEKVTGSSCPTVNPATYATANALNVLSNVTGTAENSYIALHSYVKDIERDNFAISIALENDTQGGALTTVAPQQTITRSDDREYYEVVSCFKLPDWAVHNTNEKVVTFKVSVTDIPTPEPGSPVVGNTVTGNLLLKVANDNPKPVFSDSTDVNLASFKAFAGFPFEITPPSFSDASLYDGKTILWEWQIQIEGSATWTAIPNATNAPSGNSTDAKLIWTPSPDFNKITDFSSLPAPKKVSLRLCLGDNGFGNALSTTACPTTKVWKDLVVYPSKFALKESTTNFSSGSESATWYDKTASALYTAYTFGTKIVVEKTVYGTDGELKYSASTKFESEGATGKVPVQPTSLSLAGIDQKSLFVAYKLIENTAHIPQIRVRRINLEEGRFGFHYGGLFNSGSTAIDMISNETNFSQGTFSEFDSSQLSLSISGVNMSDNFTIVLASGNLTLTVGNNPRELCHTSAVAATATLPAVPALSPCSSSANIASNMVTFINAYNTGLVAKLNGANTVQILGPSVSDYYDESTLNTPVIGNIVTKCPSGATNSQCKWYIPYSDAANSLSLGLKMGDNAARDMSNMLESSKAVTSNQFNQELAAKFDSAGNLFVASKASTGNLTIYKLNDTGSSLKTVNNQFNLSGFTEIKDLSLSIGKNDFIYIAGRSLTSAGNSFASVLITDNSLTDNVSTTNFSLINTLTSGTEKIKVSADPNVQGHAYLAMTTKATHPSGASASSKAHLAKITSDLTGAWSARTIKFIDYQSPKLNKNATVNNAAISLTPVYSVTKGHRSPASVIATPDNTKNILFYTFHEVNGANNQLNTGMFNIDSESIATQSDAIEGSYPSYIINN